MYSMHTAFPPVLYTFLFLLPSISFCPACLLHSPLLSSPSLSFFSPSSRPSTLLPLLCPVPSFHRYTPPFPSSLPSTLSFLFHLCFTSYSLLPLLPSLLSPLLSPLPPLILSPHPPPPLLLLNPLLLPPTGGPSCIYLDIGQISICCIYPIPAAGEGRDSSGSHREYRRDHWLLR